MSAEPFEVLCDSREQKPPTLPTGCVYQRATLDTGDYTTTKLAGFARIERKSPMDLVGTLTHGRERFEREADRLRAFPFRAVVVEGSAADVSKIGRIHPHALIGSICSLHARWGLPIIFLENAECVGRYIAGTLKRLEEELVAGRWPAALVDTDDAACAECGAALTCAQCGDFAFHEAGE